MNTPKTPKPPKRSNYERDRKKWSAFGVFYTPITPQLACGIGMVASEYTHLDEKMVGVFQAILGIENRDFAPLAFHAIRAPKARMDLMKAVLEKAQDHATTPGHYDEIIAEFAAITSIRNEYVHGIWLMQDGPLGPVAYLEAATGEPGAGFQAKPIPLKYFDDLLKRMGALGNRITAEVAPDLRALNERYLERLGLKPKQPPPAPSPKSPE